MRAKSLIAGAVGVLVAVGSTVAFASADGSVAGAGTAPYTNTFERPTTNAPYLLHQWAADGWKAPSDLGLADRTKIDDSTSHSGGKSLRVLYPKGKISPENSGVTAKFAVAPAKEYYLSQWIRFSPDYSWGTTEFGGKIGPGLAGGASCSGGAPCTGYNGFTSRFIWRTGGRASLYYYHMGHEGVYGDAADFKLNGASVYFPKGQWINLIQRVRVNTVTNGEANPDGKIEAWYNGQRVVNVSGLRFVRNGDLIDKAYFSSFFGGSTPSFAPQNDSYIWYDDFKASTSRADICELSGRCNVTPISAKPGSPTAGPPAPGKPTATSTASAGGTPWQPNISYAVGQVVTYNGTRYACLQAHGSLPGWEPSSVPALWRAA